MAFHDHFSGHAKAYAEHRPRYPRELFAWLASIAPARDLAVDCATGNGQAASGLSEFFPRVEANDASASQIENATGPANIHFSVAPAEATGLPSSSADLVTVAQALHWLNHEPFFTEVRRLLRPGGVFAAWGYGRFLVEEPIFSLCREALWKPLEAYWPPQRQLVETAYATIEFPLEPVVAPPFAIELTWKPQDVVDYVNTWSAAKNYRQQTNGIALDAFAARLKASWPEDATKQIKMPLFVRAGLRR